MAKKAQQEVKKSPITYFYMYVKPARLQRGIALAILSARSGRTYGIDAELEPDLIRSKTDLIFCLRRVNPRHPDRKIRVRTRDTELMTKDWGRMTSIAQKLIRDFFEFEASRR
jgi:hypothetical protein